MCPDEMLCCGIGKLQVKLAAIVARKVGRERILALAAVQTIEVFLALAGEPRVEIRRSILTFQDADIVRKFAVHAADKALCADAAVRFHMKNERACVNTCVCP